MAFRGCSVGGHLLVESSGHLTEVTMATAYQQQAEENTQDVIITVGLVMPSGDNKGWFGNAQWR